MPEYRRPLHARLRMWVRLRRRRLAAACALVAVLGAGRALTAAEDRGVRVWVASHDLGAGQVVAQRDVLARSFAPGSAPSAAITEPAQVVGREVARPVRAGEAWTDLSVAGPALRATYAGRLATPVRIGDGELAALLHPGDHVDLVAVTPDGSRPPRVVASDAVVMEVPRSSPSGSALPGGPAGRLIVVSVTRGEAVEVSAAAASEVLTAYWNR